MSRGSALSRRHKSIVFDQPLSENFASNEALAGALRVETAVRVRKRIAFHPLSLNARTISTRKYVYPRVQMQASSAVSVLLLSVPFLGLNLKVEIVS